jgi:TM2 domain-containing membrane protein YozV
MRDGHEALGLGRAEPRGGLRQLLEDERVTRAVAGAHQRLGSGIVRTFSLFVPGLGQILRGRVAAGAFFFTWIAFCAAVSWALVSTLDRLLPTLRLLGVSPVVVAWALGAAYAVAAALHLACVHTAAGPRLDNPHPLASGLASLAVPGWGQLLNGDRTRALLFLGGTWLTVAAHVVTSGDVTGLLNVYVPAVTPWEQFLRGPEILWVLRWTLPVALWTLAVYDAAASSIHRRRATAAAER